MMVDLHPAFCRDDFSFVLVAPKEKRPVQPKWQERVIRYDSEDLKEHLASGGNVGIRTGLNGLLVVDFDDEHFLNLVKKDLPDTLVCKGSKGAHYYYFCDDTTSTSIREDRGTLVDLKGNNGQVLIPNSIHPSGIVYSVVSDRPIAPILRKKLMEILQPGMKKGAKIKKRIVCPFHDDHDPSLAVYSDGNCYCFVCRSCIKEDDLNIPKERLVSKPGKNDTTLYSRVEAYDDAAGELNADDVELLRLFAIPEKFSKACYTMALRLIKKYSFLSKTAIPDGALYYWSQGKGVFCADGESVVASELSKLLGKGYKKLILTRLLEHLYVKSYKNPEEWPQQPDKRYIPFANGDYDIGCRGLLPFDVSRPFWHRLAVRYDPGAKCPVFEKYMNESISNERDRDTLIRFGGYCLYRANPFQKALLLIGGGSNGKSMFIGILQRILGSENVAGLDFADMTNNFARGAWQHAYINVICDVTSGIQNSGVFKSSFGNDIIDTDIKHGERVKFIPTFKHIVACNTLPKSSDLTFGFLRRFILVQWPYSFVEKPGQPHEKKCDPDLENKLSKEGEGITNVFLQGLHLLLQDGGFGSSTDTDDLAFKWAARNSPLNTFFDKYLCVEDDAWISYQDLMAKFEIFATNNLVRVRPSAKAWMSYLQSLGAVPTVRKVEGVAKRGFANLQWKFELQEKNDAVTGVTAKGTFDFIFKNGFSTLKVKHTSPVTAVTQPPPDSEIMPENIYNLTYKEDIVNTFSKQPKTKAAALEAIKIIYDRIEFHRKHTDKSILPLPPPEEVISSLLSDGLIYEPLEGYYVRR